MDCQKSMYGHIGQMNKERLNLNFLYNNEAYQAIIPKYKYWSEGNRKIYLSSAFCRDHWSDYSRDDLYKEFYISWDNREDMISSCKINKNEVEKLI